MRQEVLTPASFDYTRAGSPILSPVAASDDLERLDDAVLVAARVVGRVAVPESSSGVDGFDGPVKSSR